jgi:hypothetical protein
MEGLPRGAVQCRARGVGRPTHRISPRKFSFPTHEDPQVPGSRPCSVRRVSSVKSPSHSPLEQASRAARRFVSARFHQRLFSSSTTKSNAGRALAAPLASGWRPAAFMVSERAAAFTQGLTGYDRRTCTVRSKTARHARVQGQALHPELIVARTCTAVSTVRYGKVRAPLLVRRARMSQAVGVRPFDCTSYAVHRGSGAAA